MVLPAVVALLLVSPALAYAQNMDGATAQVPSNASAKATSGEDTPSDQRGKEKAIT